MTPLYKKYVPTSMTKKISIAFFIPALSLLLQYLIFIRHYKYMSPFFFWLSISIIFGCILYQVLKVELTNIFKNLILLEISLTACAFHLIYQIPYYGLRDTDVYFDLNSLKGILLNGFIRGNPEYINGTSYFPIIHLLGAQLSLLTNLCPFDVAKWLPLLMGLLLPLILYLLFFTIFKDEKISLLSTLIYIAMQNNILLGSLFIRENIAMIFFITFIYLYFSDNSPKKVILSIIFITMITLSHHLTSFILIIFFIVHMLFTNLLYPNCKNFFSKYASPRREFEINALVLVFIIPFAYWIYIAVQPLIVIDSFLRGLIQSDSSVTYAQFANIGYSSIMSLRGHVLYIGFYIFNIIFGFMLLYQLISSTKKKTFEISTFTLFHMLMGLLGFLFLYFIPTNVAILFPDRFLAYGWLFGIAPLVIFINNIKNKRISKIGVLIIFAFLLFNIYSIETPALDPSHKDVALAPSEEDYAFAGNHAFAEKFTFNNESFENNMYLCAFQNTLMSIYDKSNYLGNDLYSPISVNSNINDFNWIVVNKMDLESKRSIPNLKGTSQQVSQQVLNIDTEKSLNKVYDTNNIASYSKKIESP